MVQEAVKELQMLDRDIVMNRMAEELPEIRRVLGISSDVVADKIEMDHRRYIEIEEKKRGLEWSEYMSILFLVWNNENGRAIIESKELFPDVLKRAMSVNKNAHTSAADSS